MPSDTRNATVKQLSNPRAAKLAKFVGLSALIVFALLLPLMLGNSYLLSISIVILNYALSATAWNFMGGLTGYVSFGHAAFFGIGSYGTAILINSWGIESFTAVFLSAIIVALISVPVGYAALKVRGSSFVIVTLSFLLITLLVAQSWSSLTGGSNGMRVPRPFPDILRPEHHLRFYYIYLGVLAFAMLVWWIVERSSFGMGLKAIREDEDKARSLGVPTSIDKLIAFVLSAFFTGVAGGLYALWFGDLDPVFQFAVLVASYMSLMALVGGTYHLFGPLIGAIIVAGGIEYAKLQFGDSQIHLALVGLLLIVVVLFMPDGIIPSVQSVKNRILGGGEASIREVTAGELLDESKDEGKNIMAEKGARL